MYYLSQKFPEHVNLAYQFTEVALELSTTQWANYRGQADIGFFKIFDFMVDMALFNIQTNKKKKKIPFSKKYVQKF
jgi:hypothetical protein